MCVKLSANFSYFVYDTHVYNVAAIIKHFIMTYEVKYHNTAERYWKKMTLQYFPVLQYVLQY